MERWLTKRRLLFALTGIVFLIAWNRTLPLFYVTFSLLAATLIVAHLQPRSALAGIAARRTHPATAFEGETLAISLALSNRGFRTRRMFEVVDRVPLAEPGARGPLLLVSHLSGGDSRRFTFRVPCYKRGEYSLGPVTLHSGFPLGITRRTRQLPETVSSILVYPQIFPVAQLRLAGGARFPLRGMETTSLGGGHEEFFGTREYREGDSPRYIHWPSTARHGELIVKEFELRAATEVNIVLDLARSANVGTERDTTLEYAVKIAGSIASYAIDGGHSVQLMGFGAKRCWVPAGNESGQFKRVLDALARVEAEGELPYVKALEQALAWMGDGSTAVLFFSLSTDMAPVWDALALLQARRVRPICILFDLESFAADHVPASPANTAVPLVEQGLNVYIVRRGDDLQRIFSGV
jgi:uncharacterized protein (DUF58 family)